MLGEGRRIEFTTTCGGMRMCTIKDASTETEQSESTYTVFDMGALNNNNCSSAVLGNVTNTKVMRSDV